MDYSYEELVEKYGKELKGLGIQEYMVECMNNTELELLVISLELQQQIDKLRHDLSLLSRRR